MNPLLSMAALVGLVGLALAFSSAWPWLRLWRAQVAERKARRRHIEGTKAFIRRSMAAKALAREFPAADELEDPWFEKTPDTLRTGKKPGTNGKS